MKFEEGRNVRFCNSASQSLASALWFWPVRHDATRIFAPVFDGTIEAGFVHKLILVGVAAAVLWMARTMQRGTRGHIELRETGLYFEDGRILAAMDDILRVERGVFAFKPSNGFVVTLQNKTERAWIPGLYWKFGTRVGIGGVTAPSEAKFMSDSLAVLLEERADSPLMNMKL